MTKPMQPEQEPVALPVKLKVTLEDHPVDLELAQYKRMFNEACADLGSINEALGLDPDAGGAEPILSAIEELKARPEQEPVAEIVNKFGDPKAFAERELRTLMDIQKLPIGAKLYAALPQRQPLTDEEIEAWWQSENGMEDLNLCRRGDFFRAVRKFEAAHGIKGAK